MVAEVLYPSVADDLNVLTSDDEERELHDVVWLKTVCGEQLDDICKHLVCLPFEGGWCCSVEVNSDLTRQKHELRIGRDAGRVAVGPCRRVNSRWIRKSDH